MLRWYELHTENNDFAYLKEVALLTSRKRRTAIKGDARRTAYSSHVAELKKGDAIERVGVRSIQTTVFMSLLLSLSIVSMK